MKCLPGVIGVLLLHPLAIEGALRLLVHRHVGALRLLHLAGRDPWFLRNYLLSFRYLLLQYVSAHAKGFIVIPFLIWTNWISNVMLVHLLSTINIVVDSIEASKHNLLSQLMII